MESNQNLSPTDQRVSGRSKKMGLSAKPEFCEKLRSMSFYERRLQIEILEEALELYEKKKKTKTQTININQLLGVNNIQEAQILLTNKTLPQMVSEVNDLTNQINAYRQGIQNIEQQMRLFQGDIVWDWLEIRTKSLNPEFFNKIGLVITYQVLKEILEQFSVAGRKSGMLAKFGKYKFGLG